MGRRFAVLATVGVVLRNSSWPWRKDWVRASRTPVQNSRIIRHVCTGTDLFGNHDSQALARALGRVSIAVCLGVCLDRRMYFQMPEAVNLRIVGSLLSFVFLIVKICTKREP